MDSTHLICKYSVFWRLGSTATVYQVSYFHILVEMLDTDELFAR